MTDTLFTIFLILYGICFAAIPLLAAFAMRSVVRDVREWRKGLQHADRNWHD
jgi:hypothetical protein